MCGIVGYTGDAEAYSLLLNGIKRLEYRGYDSAGIAVLNKNAIQISKERGEIAVLEEKNEVLSGQTGIAHTRWATHGKPSKENAHPFFDCKRKIALVHNGIIENFQPLKEELVERGHEFSSDTDSEVVVHMLEEEDADDPLESLRNVVSRLEGSYAIVMVHSDHPGKLFAARYQSPLVIGVGAGEMLLASDVTPLLKHTSKVIYVDDGELVKVSPEDYLIIDAEGDTVQKPISRVSWKLEDAEKGGYKHFMLKEIFEVPQAVRDSIRGRISEGLEGIGAWKIKNLKIVACGTSYHAGLVGKYIMEEVVGLPVTTEFASEYRYSSGSRERPLVILISQSGETADTLAAAREANKRGSFTVAITNVVGSSLSRECHSTIYTRAGPEIGVAATKTWITQIVALFLLSLEMGVELGTLSPKKAESYRRELRGLPRSIYNVLDMEEEIKSLSREISGSKSMFFIGRHINYPTSLEGALKMKEISYIHAEGYAAGELKHGPLALLSRETPVVALAPMDHTYSKMLANIREVAARDAPVLAIGEEGDREIGKFSDWTLLLPRVDPLLTPITFGVALQLLSYHTADLLGCSIDKPRNLAKSVTVE